jgi:opacity protein-like surface antigen
MGALSGNAWSNVVPKVPSVSLLSIAAVCALAVSGQAAADEGSYDPYNDPYITPNGFYAGTGWGHFDLKIDNLNDVGTAVNTIVNSSDNAWKINLGYRFTPFFALEADYMDFGHPGDNFEGVGSNGNYTLHMSGFAPFAVGTLPLGPAEIFVKAGELFYDANLRVNLNAPGTEVLESSHSRSAFVYGGGLGVTLLKHLNLNIEYDQVRVENARSSNVLWLSPVWRF